MKRSQVAIAVMAAIAVGIVAVIAGGGGGDKKGGGGGGGGGKAPSGALKIPFGYSPEKEKLLLPLVKKFNDEGHEVNGKSVFVEAQNVSSGAAETGIAKGTLKLVAWTPSSSLWGRLLNFEADQPYAPKESPSIVRTPLVIAMWEPFARALGWPKKQIGFKQIIDLARSKQGFAKYGKPQFGQFKLVHTNPDFSTSGLSAVVAEYYATTGKREGLTEADVASPKVRAAVRSIERSIVHYGDTTLFVSDQMKQGGPGYASAVAMEETTLVDFNQNRGSQPKLVALYPPEGTFFSDSPFITLNAPWVSGDQKEGANEFQKFLAKQIDPKTAAQYGFRPADVNKKPQAPLDAAHGVDTSQPKRVLGLPEPRVLAAAKKTWRADRKPANVLLVVDVSGSMNEENRLARAKEGLDTFFRNLSPNDRVGLVVFSDQIESLVPLGPFSQNAERLRSTVHDLIADGGTAAFDATVRAQQAVRALKDRNRINAVVVLTDGEDTDSHIDAQQAVREVQAQGDSADQVRVFTIAYSASASGAKDALDAIAKASGGQPYAGDTDDIESVYKSISSFF